ncbi:hypothetical protein EQG63_02360 [Flavobacterium amnicola]|uniref:Bacteriophage abortive infection AbiH n=1 Tax=Flavobacterium amnicola TaxID=2506422 RepID=A0A4Q1K4W1_9FLAO|nr:AbiH family protein [Flavobacterium amnicola]RXR20798.1 hypothetical protein EQG63_02360 [Flavobacterium amnicola]
MGKILITGNGFDLFHGLPTKYGHFMAIMKSIEELSIDGKITFESLFNESFQDKYKNDYNLILENYKVEKIIYEELEINKLFQNLSKNLWYKYFKTVLEVDTWIDFEIEIENVLSQLALLFDYMSLNHNKQKRLIPIQEINIDENFFVFGFTRFHNENYNRLNDDFIKKKNQKIDELKILKLLSSSLDEFKSIFNSYLENIVYKLFEFKKTETDFPFNQLTNIFTFNYTPTVERLYNINIEKVIYLHGKSNSKDDIQNLVMGISDIEGVIKNHKMYDFAKYYQKFIGNSNQKFIKVPKQKTNSLNEHIFYIIGHSLDKSDKEYISEIFKFLEYDLKKRSKICIFYYDKNDMESKSKNLFSIIDKNLIIEFNKEGRIYFVELNNQNIKIELNKTIYNDYSGENRISIR